MRAEEFVAKLDGVRRSGSGWTARCPAHEDAKASLSVSVGDEGRVLVKCFAGCTAQAIVAALGLQMSDLMPEREKPKTSRSEIVAAYDYRDADGTLVFQAVRYEPKAFKQRRPDGKGGWVWNLDGVRRVLYRLPELLAAEKDRRVFVVEGEKDADRLADLALLATTSAGGAGKWQQEFSEFLRGRLVAILPDADEPGRGHAEAVARSLYDVAESVTVLELPGLPPKGDVSDWLDSGHTIDELNGLVTAAPAWKPPPAPNLAALLDGLLVFVRRFVFMTEAQAVAWALWVAHTHALDAAEQTPYLSITSPEKRSGKTRVLEVSELLVARPWLTGRVSAAALVRKIDKERPSLLLDESDAAFSGEKEYAEALRGLLNTGHRANGRASVCVGQGAALDVRDFSTFCPKAIAGIGKLPDTVADRAIPVRLQRKAGAEKVEQFRERKARPESSPLRAKLETWAAANMMHLRAAEPELPDELSDRAKDGAEPLLAIADLAGGEWPEKARRALVELLTGDNPEDDSLGVRLLRDCRAVFEARPDADKLASSDLCAALVELEESPWRELHKGKPLTLRGLARLLNPFGVLSGTVRLGEATAKGYHRATFEDPWSRYLTPAGSPSVTASQANPGAGFVSFRSGTRETHVTDEKRGIVNAGAGCDAVTDRNAPRERGRSLSDPAGACAYFTGATTAGTCGGCSLPYAAHV